MPNKACTRHGCIKDRRGSKAVAWPLQNRKPYVTWQHSIDLCCKPVKSISIQDYISKIYGEKISSTHQPNFSIDESDVHGFKKINSIKLPSISKINTKHLFKEYKNNRATLAHGLDKKLLYMYFIWDFASSLLPHFEKLNKRKMESYWGYSKWNDVKYIDNKAEIARSKMLLGNTYEDPLKNAYFSILASAYKVKITIEPARHSIRGIRFIDFIKEDFDVKKYGVIYDENRLLRIFRSLLERCEALSDQIYQSIKNPKTRSKGNNSSVKNIIRHTGKQSLKDDIVTYILNLDIEEIKKFNKTKKNSINKKESEISEKYPSIPAFCKDQEHILLKIFHEYKSNDETKNTTFADIALYEAPNYLKDVETPNFERIFRAWIDEKDQTFNSAINRVVLIKEKKSK